MAEEVAPPNNTNGTNSKPTILDVGMDQTLVDSIGAASSLVNTEQLITCQTDTCQSSVPMSNAMTSQVPTCTLTPITTVTSMVGESQAALLFLLNSSSLPSQADTNTSSGPFGNAVFVPQPVTINVMAQGQNSLSKVTNSYGDGNVIEKAMDLANLGEMSGGESIQHPVANAALTLVSLGTAVGQPVQEIVIDESGRSSLSHASNLGEVSVTVESEGSSHMVSKTQVDSCTMVVPTSTSVISNDDDSIDDKTELRTKLREVITQTGAGEKEVVVLKAMEKSVGKSLSTLLVDQSLERKRLAELKEAQKEVIEKERTHPCDKCEKKFFTKHDLKRHSLVHSEVRPYDCQTCKKAFRTPNELKLHLPVHNTDTPYKCEFCGKEFRTKGCIKSHIKYHIGDKRHKCTTCGRAFVKSADLKRHIAAHNNEKKYKCDECDSMFTRRDNLKAHMLLHSRKSVVTCKMCNKEFINEVYLKRHMHIHKQAKKKPYECQWCPKTYEQLEGLRRHIRQHVGDEKFVCEHCAKKFITAIQLKRHLWLSHEQNSPYRKSVL